MNLVAQTHPTEKERQRMLDIFGEAFELTKAPLSILLRQLGKLIGVTNDIFDEVSPMRGDISRGIMLTSMHYGYVMIMPHSKHKGVVNLIPFDVDGEKISDGALVSIKEPEKILDVAKELITELERDMFSEEEYQGRDVPLNKPMQGDVKKFKVFVKDPGTGNVKKVNFGDPNMRIKKSNPERRKSFRARHKCDTAKDKTTPRYWSCRKW